MRLFCAKSEEQKQFEAEQRQKQLKLEEQIVDALREIYVFPGTKGEFEDFIGYQTDWVDFGKKDLGLLYNPDKYHPFVNYDFNFQKKIVEFGVVALVNANYSHNTETSHSSSHTSFYGMPVKRK